MNSIMDWGLSTTNKKRAPRKKSGFRLGKSSSEPNLTDHFTPRFPHNLSKLLHEYVSVDNLKYYRKRRTPHADDGIQSNFSLYDKSVAPLPFSVLKTEYKKEFGKSYGRSHSVPKTIGNLTRTTDELIGALRDDDDTDVITVPDKSKRLGRPVTAKISGDIEFQADADVFASIMKPYAQVRQSMYNEGQTQKTLNASTSDPNALNMRSCTLKLEGELTYTPEYQSQYQRHQSIERSQSIPPMSNIEFRGKFQGVPEYQENYKGYADVAKREPLKRDDHLKLSPRINAAGMAQLRPYQTSEYSDRFKEKVDKSPKVPTPSRRKPSANSSIKKHLISSPPSKSMPEYQEKYKDPEIRRMPTMAKAREHQLSLDGDMEYIPEYRSSFLDFARTRPTTKRPDTQINLNILEMPSSSGSLSSPPLRAPILAKKFSSTHTPTIEPSKNIHHPTGVDVDPSFLCQPEVRKARHGLLIRKRPPSPSKTLSANIRKAGQMMIANEEDENKIYNAKSHIVSSDTKPLPITVTVEDFDDPNDNMSTVLTVNSPPKYGRRASMNVINNNNQKPSSNETTKGHVQRQRNRAKIIEGNRDYFNTNLPKKNSFSSTTTTTLTDDETSMMGPPKSFVILNDPLNENNWMKSSQLY